MLKNYARLVRVKHWIESHMRFLLKHLRILILSVATCLSSSNVFGGDQNYYWEACNHMGGTTIPFSGSITHPRFLPNCAPDILYSWQIFDAKKNELFARDPFAGDSELYTWRTPLGTFGYGSTQVRLKLKPGVKFKWILKEDQNCKKFTTAENQTTVYVSLAGPPGASEYFLCSQRVVESWSKNTEGAYLEAKKELEYIQSHFDSKKQTYDTYGIFTKRRQRIEFHFIGVNPYFSLILDSGTDWSETRLMNNLERLNQKTDLNDGIVFFRQDSATVIKDHFVTNVNSYFKITEQELDHLNP